MKRKLFFPFILLFVSASAAADWYPYRDWYWTDTEGSAQTAALHDDGAFAYVVYAGDKGGCFPMLAMQLPAGRTVTGLQIQIDNEVWTANSPKRSLDDEGTQFIFNAIGEDLVAAVKGGELMAIGTDHGRYAFSLSGSAKTINLAQAVCRGEKKVYAAHLPADRHQPAVAAVADLRIDRSSTGTSFGPSYVIIGEARITEGYALRAKRKIEQSGARLIIVDSDGGLIDEAMALGTWIREQGLDTAVVHSCASACVEVFAGGRERLVRTEAQVGIHQISIGNAFFDSAEAGQYSVAQGADYFARMGIDAELVIARSAVPADQMKWVTGQEAVEWNLITGLLSEDIDARIPPVVSASDWGDYEPAGTVGMAEGYDPTAILLLFLMFGGTGVAMAKINARIRR
jgi:hypothetical protein